MKQQNGREKCEGEEFLVHIEKKPFRILRSKPNTLQIADGHEKREQTKCSRYVCVCAIRLQELYNKEEERKKTH